MALLLVLMMLDLDIVMSQLEPLVSVFSILLFERDLVELVQIHCLNHQPLYSSPAHFAEVVGH